VRPLPNDIYAGYKKAGFVLLGVNLDESADDAKAFLKKTPVNFPVLLDSQGKVADLYKNQAMPSSYFVDRKGNLVHLHQGYKPGEEAEYKRVIKKLLAQ
jgi:peroxiredoxin